MRAERESSPADLVPHVYQGKGGSGAYSSLEETWIRMNMNRVRQMSIVDGGLSMGATLPSGALADTGEWENEGGYSPPDLVHYWEDSNYAKQLRYHMGAPCPIGCCCWACVRLARLRCRRHGRPAEMCGPCARERMRHDHATLRRKGMDPMRDEGDDAYVMLVPGEPVTRAQVDDLVDVLSRAALCVEEQAYSFLQIYGEARVREMLSAEPTRVADPAEPDRTAPARPPADR